MVAMAVTLAFRGNDGGRNTEPGGSPKTSAAVFKNPANRHRAVSLTAEQFRLAFASAVSVNVSQSTPRFPIPGSSTTARPRRHCGALQIPVEVTRSARVRVNTVSPGPVDTGLWLGPGSVAETVARAQATDPATVRTAAITGTDVLIDGGMVTIL
jgi:hypothetical protein